MKKRGQSSIFIIAGIVIVIVAVLIVFFTREDIQVGGRITSTQVEPIREYIGDCIKERLESDLKTRRRLGGRESLDFSAREPLSKYNVLNRPFNNLPSLYTIEQGISRDIKDYIKSNGCSLNDFRNNFVISEQRDIVDAQLNISDSGNIINLVVTYPVIIEKGDFKTELDTFNVILEDDFGRIHSIINDILNGAAEDARINIADYCQSSDVICSVVENNGGLRLVQIGNREDFPPAGEQGKPGDVFIFVIAP